MVKSFVLRHNWKQSAWDKCFSVFFNLKSRYYPYLVVKFNEKVVHLLYVLVVVIFRKQSSLPWKIGQLHEFKLLQG